MKHFGALLLFHQLLTSYQSMLYYPGSCPPYVQLPQNVAGNGTNCRSNELSRSDVRNTNVFCKRKKTQNLQYLTTFKKLPASFQYQAAPIFFLNAKCLLRNKPLLVVELRPYQMSCVVKKALATQWMEAAELYGVSSKSFHALKLSPIKALPNAFQRKFPLCMPKRSCCLCPFKMKPCL